MPTPTQQITQLIEISLHHRTIHGLSGLLIDVKTNLMGWIRKLDLSSPILVVVGTVLVLSSVPAGAVKITAVQESSWGQATAGVYDVKGSPTGVGDRIDVTYTLPTPGSLPITKTDVGTLNQSGVAVIKLGVPKGTIITFTNSSEAASAPAITALAEFTPPRQTVITPLTASLGSTVTLGTSTFGLTGNFATVATAIDYDPTSPNYGDLSGVIPASAFDIQGTGATGNIFLSLISDLPWMVDMAPVWVAGSAVDLIAAGLSVPFSTPLSGTLTTGVGSTPFSGTVTGSVTFFSNDTEIINATLDFTSGLGPIKGSLVASGESFLIPEPSTITLVGLGTLGLLGYSLWRKTNTRTTGSVSHFKLLSYGTQG